MARKVVGVFISFLAVFLLGTVVVLSTVVAFFGVDSVDVVTESEMMLWERSALVTFGPSVPDSSQDRSAAAVFEGEAEEEAEEAVAAAIGNQDASYEGEGVDPDSVWDGIAGLAERSAGGEEPTREEDKELPPRIAKSKELRKRSGALSGEEGEVILPQLVPKIVHQTWKTATLPERWDNIRQSCMALHPE